jgi:hypothetical protein
LHRELRARIPFGTVSRNERFHKAQVEILQGITRSLAQATEAWSQLRLDIDKPGHQQLNLGRSCAAGLRGCFQEIFHVPSTMGGNSSIWRETTFRKRTPTHFGLSKLCEDEADE